MAISKYLNSIQKKAIINIGNIYLPGFDHYPKFEERVRIQDIDRILKYLYLDDLKGLLILFNILGLMPVKVLNVFINTVQKDNFAPLIFGVLFRQINLGLKGICNTLYYSKLTSSDTKISELLEYNSSIPFTIKDHELEDLYQKNDFNAF